MRHPEQGFVVTFSISSQPTGFFYLDTNEIIQRNEVPSISKHMSKGTLSFEDFPDDLKQTIYQYMTQVESGPIDLRTVGKEVARPMRFYVYPESQGNGSLKVLLSLVTLSTAILNRDKKEIYQLVEARAGIADGVDTPQGSISAVSDHQLVPAYLAKGYDPSRLNGSGILVWNNNPYRNMSITRKIEVPKTLSLAQTKFIK